jgi:hypothetical protein
MRPRCQAQIGFRKTDDAFLAVDDVAALPERVARPARAMKG